MRNTHLNRIATTFAFLLLGLIARTADAAPITPFDFLAAAKVDVRYGPDSCFMGFCGAGFELGLVAATTDPVNMQYIDAAAYALDPLPAGVIQVAAGGSIFGTLLPGEVGNATLIIDPIWFTVMLPGESFRLLGTGLGAGFNFTEGFSGDFTFGARVVLDHAAAHVSFPINVNVVYDPELRGRHTYIVTITEAQRLSAVPEPGGAGLLVFGMALAAARRYRKGQR